MPQNYISQIKKILEHFSQNKKNKLTEKNFLVPSARDLTWIKNMSQN